MEHKSPTDEEYGIELKEMVTPSLPSDRNRYVDYLDKNLVYKKIVYPNFFRIVLDENELDYPGANRKIKNLLDAKSIEIALLASATSTITPAAPVSTKDIMDILEKLSSISTAGTVENSSASTVGASDGNLLSILEKLKSISSEEVVGGTTETATPGSNSNLLEILDRIKDLSGGGAVVGG